MTDKLDPNVAKTADDKGALSYCFYGAGSMAEAILRGLTEARLAEPSRITALNRSDAARLERLAARYGVRAGQSEADKERALREADIVVLAMKPKDAAAAIARLRPLLRPQQLLVSVIAGLSVDTIHKLLGAPQPVARTMPNTSSTIGLGATGIFFSSGVSAAQRELTLKMFDAIGLTAVVDEPLLDAVTGISGSGPAYIYYMMETMIASGVKLGLSPEIARALTVQTVRGAAAMVDATGEAPDELRRKVTSPNGSTQAALEVMDRFSFREGVSQAIVRCAERAREMGEAIREQAVKGE